MEVQVAVAEAQAAVAEAQTAVAEAQVAVADFQEVVEVIVEMDVVDEEEDENFQLLIPHDLTTPIPGYPGIKVGLLYYPTRTNSDGRLEAVRTHFVRQVKPCRLIRYAGSLYVRFQRRSRHLLVKTRVLNSVC